MLGQEIVLTIRKSSMTPDTHTGVATLDGHVVASSTEQGSVAVMEALKEQIISKDIAIASDWSTSYRPIR